MSGPKVEPSTMAEIIEAIDREHALSHKSGTAVLIGQTVRKHWPAIREELNRRAPSPAPAFDLIAHLAEQSAWSLATFGPGDGVDRHEGIADHIRKELDEIAKAPNDLEEWIDLVMLSTDGAWRTGATPAQIAAAWKAKLEKNKARKWPDWRTAEPGKAIEHVRETPSPAHAPEFVALVEAVRALRLTLNANGTHYGECCVGRVGEKPPSEFCSRTCKAVRAALDAAERAMKGGERG